MLADLASTAPDDQGRLEDLAGEARRALLAAPMPEAIGQAVVTAYRALADESGEAAPAVAVRSSATAEDLPTASFAGQQDTYLNVVGEAALLDAVRRCWASLWTDRAVAYRARNGIEHRAVRLAVVVQRMVDATVAGVLFTANPLTGQRRQAVIDASPGLGEAIVSGAVNPDHFVVDVASGDIVERRLGDKRVAVRPAAGGGIERVEVDEIGAACLSDEQLRALAALGAQVEDHYGAPQDTEFAFDATGRLWLLQARPITTLFPLPGGTPPSDDALRVYFSFNVAQGVLRPITPMGIQIFRLFGSAAATLLGRPPADRLAGPGMFKVAALRVFFDVTPALRTPLGRRLFVLFTSVAEARTSVAVRHLLDDPRLVPEPLPAWRVARWAIPTLARTRLPLRVVAALVDPAAARARLARAAHAALALGDVPATATDDERLDAVERLFRNGLPHLLPFALGTLIAGLGSFAVAGRLLDGIASEAELETVRRALPHNPTSEMDLALWGLAERARADAAATRAIREVPSARLADQYLAGTLPATLHDGLTTFLATYGHRGVAEIDVGLARWSEEPTHILGVLANYLATTDPIQAPDAQFRRAAEHAEATVAALASRAAERSRPRGALVGFLLGRTRALAGQREAPKFHVVAMFARARALLQSVGAELASAGRLDQIDDVFFLTLSETRAAVTGQNVRETIGERRAFYERERRRRHVPRLLLSDGTEPEASLAPPVEANGALRGTPASSGVVTARARVILNPTGARLEPGEILVAPSTDPGWTPLFLTAGGLVMEMGGAMSHGTVVAREHGIPAVVGVAGATEQISTGQRVSVDGAAGLVRAHPDQ